MDATKIDPRIIRTKNYLLMPFKSIKRKEIISSVKDITDEATVNRATFYAHFTDKYDILDYTPSVTILKDLNDTLNISEVINEEIFLIYLFLLPIIWLKFKILEMNSEEFCNQAHKRINNELEDIFTIMLENSFLVMNERYW